MDFYGSSILYDFAMDVTTICDIDLFRTKPAWNDMGVHFWGSHRFKAPEEYCFGAVLDEKTNIHAGRHAFSFPLALQKERASNDFLSAC